MAKKKGGGVPGFSNPEVQARAVDAARAVGGRGEGKLNKEIKDQVRLIVEGNLDKFQGWIDKLGERDPEAALNAITKLLPFVMPKQQHIATSEIKEIVQINEHRSYGEAEVIPEGGEDVDGD
jgi:hypothetical protein